MNTKKFDAADKASTIIIEHFHEAARLLSGGIDYNGAGVLADPSSAKWRLRDAKARIEKALEVHKTTNWPTSADYAEYENGR